MSSYHSPEPAASLQPPPYATGNESVKLPFKMSFGWVKTVNRCVEHAVSRTECKDESVLVVTRHGWLAIHRNNIIYLRVHRLQVPSFQHELQSLRNDSHTEYRPLAASVGNISH